MTKKILTQICNEWRSNVWLALELLIVSVVLWYIVDYVYTLAVPAMRPLGADVENCFNIQFENEEIDEGEETDIAGSRQEILERLRRHPDVEAACLSCSAYPYSMGWWGGSFSVDSFSSHMQQRIVTPDYVRVFRIRGMNGESEDSLARLLELGKLVITRNILPERFNASSYIGKRMIVNEDSLNTKEVGAVIPALRRNDYEQKGTPGGILIPLTPEKYGMGGSFSVRVKPGAAAGFRERFLATADKEFTTGIFFVSDVKPFDDIREESMRMENRRLRDYLAVMGFLMVNVFMGLLGTFWFRTQQRVKDIAVRKVAGATAGQVFGMLIGEGLLLLTAVTPVALLIDANIAHLELNAYLDMKFLTWGRLLICGGASYLLMALMITLGIAIPARRAMHIAPAEALKDE